MKPMQEFRNGVRTYIGRLEKKNGLLSKITRRKPATGGRKHTMSSDDSTSEMLGGVGPQPFAERAPGDGTQCGGGSLTGGRSAKQDSELCDDLLEKGTRTLGGGAFW